VSCAPVFPVYVKLAVPLTVIAPENAEVATREPARAVSPAFFQVFIFSPICLLIIIIKPIKFYRLKIITIVAIIYDKS
jgi:hypothetical protein